MTLRTVIFAAATLLMALVPASARQLAVGAAAGFIEPPGYRAVPVYVWPNGGRWTPVDTTMGYPFREPIYSTPRGYRYVYVRGYYWKRVPNPYAPRVYKRVVKASYAKPRRRGGPCITDIGNGRYQFCSRFY
ncbi:hypothetical protein [Pseudorhodoplanes sinuspersici]|uniref:Uncharacterized protein n=1 Tax=Pseudorhodoplanes sinuspersici TaxID=1235591 RepID=A0A1W6ZSH6_9HYPH|nr:hypothetical protein [Pseudorhodoplanes sinuspersici]ARQ00293.1 hypothetical protein CAK95_15340 [Pseudorhodoplanes sinuspersici]RKE67551.1 hypothetical protein DFP91_5317 [Pseudorhodoplanes sinuspersici]